MLLVFIMKRISAIFLSAILLFAGCGDPVTPDPDPDPIVKPVRYDGSSFITYQLLVYSFCDSDGDGIGDFNGITSRLDYLRAMGVRAIWLSPVHKATSYHGYDVEDYCSINPEYGTEADFQSLLKAAHEKDIKIYLDFVLNHSSREHPWFIEGKTNPDSKYRNYYHFSNVSEPGYSSTVTGTDPGKINVKFTLKCAANGTPLSLRADKVETVTDEGAPGSGKYLWYGSVTESTMPEFHFDGNDTYTLSVKDFESSWGVLVRTSKTEWGARKFGAEDASNRKLVWGVPLKLKSNSDNDILMPWMGTIWYQSVFGEYMPDINYGPASSCEESDSFKDVCTAADKWIKMGVDGFRLDAVKHIYDNARSDENPAFLKKFYDHCNATYKAGGGKGDIYMVGEMWDDPMYVAPYYKGLPAFFEFAFWDRLKDAIKSGSCQNFVSDIRSYQSLYKYYREDYVEATKLTNHDEDRAGNDLGRSTDKMKLAAAVLLTCSGEPYIYQGEELGYWGSRSGGDEYVRAPVKWTKSGGTASAKLGGRVDNAMLSSAISVEAQSSDPSSVLKVYRDFGMAREKYEALAIGETGVCSEVSSLPSICAYYRKSANQNILVVHNFGSAAISINFSTAKLDNLILSNGTAAVRDGRLTLGPWSSALFLQ